MTTEKKTVNARMYNSLIAQLLTNQPSLASLDFECTKAAIGMSDLNLRFAEWVNNGCQVERVEKPAKPEPPPVPEPVITVYKLTVNYSRPLADVVEDGKYDWVNSDFNQNNFLVVGKGTVDEELYTIHFQRDLDDEALVAECKRLGYEIVGNTEGAHFGAKYPKLQKQFPIIFGSVWQLPDGFRSRPYLDRRGTERVLDLYWFGQGYVWGASCRVLVRKIRNSVAR